MLFYILLTHITLFSHTRPDFLIRGSNPLLSQHRVTKKQFKKKIVSFSRKCDYLLLVKHLHLMTHTILLYLVVISSRHPVLCIVVLYTTSTPHTQRCFHCDGQKLTFTQWRCWLLVTFKQRLWTCLRHLIAAAFLLLLMGQLKIQTWAKIGFITRNLFINGFKTLILLTHLYY